MPTETQTGSAKPTPTVTAPVVAPANVAPSARSPQTTASLINDLARQEEQRLRDIGFTDGDGADTDTEASGGEDTATEGLNAPTRDSAPEGDEPEDSPQDDASPAADGPEPDVAETADPTPDPEAAPEATPEAAEEPATEADPADPDTDALRKKFPRLKPEEQAALGAKIAEERRKAIEKLEAEKLKPMQSRIEELTQALDDFRNTAPPPKDVPLAHVPADKLPEFERGLTEALDLSETALLKVQRDPEAVAALFKAKGIQTPENADADTMEQWLLDSRSAWKQALRQVPQRKEYLEVQRQTVPALQKMFPALADKASPLSLAVERVAANWPGIKAIGTWQVEAVKYLLGNERFSELLKGAQAQPGATAPKAATAPKPPTAPPRRGVAPAVSATNGQAINTAAEKKLRLTGSRAALVELNMANFR
jgi:hypothetical protein